MKIRFTHKTMLTLMLTVAIMLTASCTWIIEPSELESGDTMQDVPMENGNQAFINTVEVVQRDGGHYAVVTGWYPDACSTTDEIVQEVAGDAINVTITSKRPADMVCAAVLTEFEETFLLDTEDLDPGEYAVTVNDVSASTSLSVE